MNYLNKLISSQENKSSFWFWAILFIPFGLYIAYFTEDFPIQDDVNFIDYLYHSKKALTPLAYIQYLFRIDNDHCQAIGRLIVHACYLIEGKINFKILQLLSIVELLGILYVCFLMSKPILRSNWQFVPIFLAICQVNYFEIFNWSITSISILPCLLFFLIALFLREKKLGWSLFLLFYHVFHLVMDSLLTWFYFYFFYLKNNGKKLHSSF